jgi:hypothetical protein
MPAERSAILGPTRSCAGTFSAARAYNKSGSDVVERIANALDFMGFRSKSHIPHEWLVGYSYFHVNPGFARAGTHEM